MGQRAFILEDELLDRAPAGAAVRFGPVVGEPAALIEEGVPFLHVGLAEVHAAGDLAGQAGRQPGGQKVAHFIAQGFFLEGEVQVHVVSSVG